MDESKSFDSIKKRKSSFYSEAESEEPETSSTSDLSEKIDCLNKRIDDLSDDIINSNRMLKQLCTQLIPSHAETIREFLQLQLNEQVRQLTFGVTKNKPVRNTKSKNIYSLDFFFCALRLY